MGMCFLYGGAKGLPMHILSCQTRPETAGENTVWCGGSEAPGYWVAPVRPENVAEGTLWVKTATAGNRVRLQKGNPIDLYIAGVCQYTGGQWKELDYSVFAEGNWTEVSRGERFLYRTGDKCTDLTGGWGTYGYEVWWKDSSYDLCNAVFQTDRIALNSRDGYVCFAGINKVVSLANVSKIEIDWQATAAASDDPDETLYLEVSSDKRSFGTESKRNRFLSFGAPGRRRVDTLDVSGISGDVFLAVYIWNTSGGCKGNVYSIKLISQ